MKHYYVMRCEARLHLGDDNDEVEFEHPHGEAIHRTILVVYSLNSLKRRKDALKDGSLYDVYFSLDKPIEDIPARQYYEDSSRPDTDKKIYNPTILGIEIIK